MSGYVDNFFINIASYINVLWTADIIKYLLSFYVILCVFGLLRSLLHINDRKGV